MPLHPLLQRQLRKMGLLTDAPPTAEKWSAFLERISSTYGEADQDRYMTERALQRSSEEMWHLYDELKASSAAEISRQREELARNLALMTGVQESVNEAILVIDANGIVLTCNNRWLEMWDLPREAVEGVDRAAIRFHAQNLVLNPDEFVTRVSQLDSDPNATATDEVKLRDGRILSRFTAPVRSPSGSIGARLWCFRDVTEERKLTQRRAVVAERMASVGQLVSSVAHEVNNPLAYIAGNVDVVVDALQAGGELETDELIEALEDARTGVDRIKVIVRDLGALSRVDEESRAPTDIRVVLDSALQMANNELRHRARIVREFGNIPLVSANAVRLGQVFLNLLLNAAHAIPDGRASDNVIHVVTSTSPLGYARIEIRDSGSGIEPSILERIYDPFFTTKTLGTGTGLGLSICKGIVDKLGGMIEVESEVGVGTVFAVEIPPASIESLAPQKASHTSAPPSSERRSILVVDDDAQIRRWFMRVLPHHEVTAVPSVEAAQEALDQRTFDVILCDVMMPDRTGLDMYHFIQEKKQELLPHLIFMSGGVFTPALAKFLENVPNTCLKKPFRKHEVERAILAVAKQPQRLVAQEAVQTDSSRSFTLT